MGSNWLPQTCQKPQSLCHLTGQVLTFGQTARWIFSKIYFRGKSVIPAASMCIFCSSTNGQHNKTYFIIFSLHQAGLRCSIFPGKFWTSNVLVFKTRKQITMQGSEDYFVKKNEFLSCQEHFVLQQEEWQTYWKQNCTSGNFVALGWQHNMSDTLLSNVIIPCE